MAVVFALTVCVPEHYLKSFRSAIIPGRLHERKSNIRIERSIEPDAMCWAVGLNRVAKTSPECPSRVLQLVLVHGLFGDSLSPVSSMIGASSPLVRGTCKERLAVLITSTPSSLGKVQLAHTDWTKAPFCAEPLTSAVPGLAASALFLLTTSSWEDPKVAGAGRFSPDIIRTNAAKDQGRKKN